MRFDPAQRLLYGQSNGLLVNALSMLGSEEPENRSLIRWVAARYNDPCVSSQVCFHFI